MLSQDILQIWDGSDINICFFLMIKRRKKKCIVLNISVRVSVCRASKKAAKAVRVRELFHDLELFIRIRRFSELLKFSAKLIFGGIARSNSNFFARIVRICNKRQQLKTSYTCIMIVHHQTLLLTLQYCTIHDNVRTASHIAQPSIGLIHWYGCVICDATFTCNRSSINLLTYHARLSWNFQLNCLRMKIDNLTFMSNNQDIFFCYLSFQTFPKTRGRGAQDSPCPCAHVRS